MVSGPAPAALSLAFSGGKAIGRHFGSWYRLWWRVASAAPSAVSGELRWPRAFSTLASSNPLANGRSGAGAVRDYVAICVVHTAKIGSFPVHTAELVQLSDFGESCG